MQIKLRYYVFIISIILLITGTTASVLFLNDFGKSEVKEINLTTQDGTKIHATLQIPTDASVSNPLPAVVVVHGSAQCKEWLYTFSVELVRRNFIVLSIDAASHGNSDFSGNRSMRGGIAALQFLDSLDYVDNIGMIGHSMGSGISITAIEESSIQVDALVVVGGGWFDTDEPWANSTYPHNILYTVGRYDELFDVPKIPEQLQTMFNTPSAVQPNQLYGNFTAGTARKLVIGTTNHLFETADPVILSEAVAWMQNSLYGPDFEPHLSHKNLIYPYHIVAGLLRILGLLGTIFPLGLILLHVDFFQPVSHTDGKIIVRYNKYFLYSAISYILLSLVAIIPAVLFSRSLPFPQGSYGALVVLWLLTASILLLGFLLLLYRYKFREAVQWDDFGLDTPFSKLFIKNSLKAAVLAVVLSVWMYIWVFIVDYYFHLDFRAFLPFLSDLTIKRFMVVPVYLIITVPYFFVDGMWLMGFLKRQSAKHNAVGVIMEVQQSWKERLSHIFTVALTIKLLPYVCILLVQFIGSIIIGQALIPGYIGFQLLFLYAFVPFFTITVLIHAVFYVITNKIYVGSFINACIFSWAIAALLPLSF